MFGLLEQILCWIKQIGAMVLNALIGALNLLIAAVGGAANALVSAWPIGMPGLPEAPSELGTAMSWVKWTPLPISAALAFLLFAISVWIAWMLGAVILRWAKAID